MNKIGARQIIDAEVITVAYLHKVMRNLFPKNNDCAPVNDLVEVIEELNIFGIYTKKELRLFLKKHREQLLEIDKSPLDKVHQRIYRDDIGEVEFLDCIRRQYWFCYPALVRTAMEIEFGNKYEEFANKRDET